MKKLIHHIEEALKINSRSKVKKSEPLYKEFIKEYSNTFNVFNSEPEIKEIINAIKEWCKDFNHKEEDLICVVDFMFTKYLSLCGEYSKKFNYFLKCCDFTFDVKILANFKNTIEYSEDFILLKYSNSEKKHIFISTEDFYNKVEKYNY